MPAGLYWLEDRWPGRLAVAARPRGGDWISDDIAGWKRAGVNSVLSLLTREEEKDLDLGNESSEVTAQGMRFDSFPIPDRQVPASRAAFAGLLETLNRRLSAGDNVVVHCRQGIGRSGLVATGLLVMKGLSPGAAVERLSAVRGIAIPETPEQRDWIDQYAASLAGSR